MKIKPFHIQPLHTYANKTKPAKTTSGQSFLDKVEISSAAIDMKGTTNLQSARAERVAQIKADVQSGEYKVDTHKVAEDMLKYYRF
ncbi:hypothetical protein GCM10007425_04360 [Lysinibacillus alkalisoli]|uniref:Negative regulator of flagellin synthesis n=1 Tax=Lysinibacillus alkalisoli TaxID=1911548 RepID=A0A917D6Z5_9BACI|nr:flagellar biosynthesis anti-sigma factor FlgM [Lysinibacillus alkalisoli]GGG13182.1 hypothetical protein GCM10007425_04360 [Lysinibacillus alkalisoli]